MNDDQKFFFGCMIVFLVLLALFVFPYFTMLALNYLFDLSLTYTFKTWLALTWLTFIFSGPSHIKSK